MKSTAVSTSENSITKNSLKMSTFVKRYAVKKLPMSTLENINI